MPARFRFLRVFVELREHRVGQGSAQTREGAPVPGGDRILGEAQEFGHPAVSELLDTAHFTERLPIGLKEILENAPVEALTSFYEDWYRPDLMAVIAVGDFDLDAMRARITEHFSRIAPREVLSRNSLFAPKH